MSANEPITRAGAFGDGVPRPADLKPYRPPKVVLLTPAEVDALHRFVFRRQTLTELSTIAQGEGRRYFLVDRPCQKCGSRRHFARRSGQCVQCRREWSALYARRPHVRAKILACEATPERHAAKAAAVRRLRERRRATVLNTVL